jgi:hypothetical protein
LSLRSNLGLKLANAFGVIVYEFKLTHYFFFAVPEQISAAYGQAHVFIPAFLQA